MASQPMFHVAMNSRCLRKRLRLRGSSSSRTPYAICWFRISAVQYQEKLWLVRQGRHYDSCQAGQKSTEDDPCDPGVTAVDGAGRDLADSVLALPVGVVPEDCLTSDCTPYRIAAKGLQVLLCADDLTRSWALYGRLHGMRLGSPTPSHFNRFCFACPEPATSPDDLRCCVWHRRGAASIPPRLLGLCSPFAMQLSPQPARSLR